MAARYSEEERNIIADIVSENRTMKQILFIAAERLPHRSPYGIRSYIVDHDLPYIRVNHRWTDEQRARVNEVKYEQADVIAARVSDVSTIDRPLVESRNRLSLTAALKQAADFNNRNNT